MPSDDFPHSDIARAALAVADAADLQERAFDDARQAGTTVASEATDRLIEAVERYRNERARHAAGKSPPR